MGGQVNIFMTSIIKRTIDWRITMEKKLKTPDLDKVSANIKKAAAKLREKNATIKELTAKLGVKKKYASMGQEQVPAEVAKDVKEKLIENNVSEEDAQQAADIVEVATQEAISNSDASPEGEGEVVVSEEMEGEGKDEILGEDVKETLSDLATDEDVDEEVKQASLKLLNSAGKGKKAFNRALIEIVKSVEPTVSGGYVASPRKSASAGGKTQALRSLQNYADKG